MQVDRYKQLLLKQRDIMIALTARLNERDEQILTLQEELGAYDVHQKCGLAGSVDSSCFNRTLSVAACQSVRKGLLAYDERLMI
jgi:hypothetical protein